MVINGKNLGLWFVFHIEALSEGTILARDQNLADYYHQPLCLNRFSKTI